jgi:hypothetical protein
VGGSRWDPRGPLAAIRLVASTAQEAATVRSVVDTAALPLQLAITGPRGSVCFGYFAYLPARARDNLLPPAPGATPLPRGSRASGTVADWDSHEQVACAKAHL